jgi:diadenosine tetraphosphate (Ap4A) HIT family hydrolase
VTDCELCTTPGGKLLLTEHAVVPAWRAILVDDPDYPGYARVVATRHAKELSDLTPDERGRVFDAVVALERAVLEVVTPDKVNVASLGNVVPHVHFHVIPRWTTDPRWPAPIWAAPRREAPPRLARSDLADQLREAMRRHLQTEAPQR